MWTMVGENGLAEPHLPQTTVSDDNESSSGIQVRFEYAVALLFIAQGNKLPIARSTIHVEITTFPPRCSGLRNIKKETEVD